ncbi:hypothetical protein SeLEV6574_g05080 [Synchytrium endobioticum]|uniref:Uncharacterized protein n=1 Tax=Synchytrium endobioticum TaxID=286115 RepID=A0A507CW00_9FUNG|nr:hypothetical protein SeLEV6574_g05080 [Synchytrium endobioticum]
MSHRRGRPLTAAPAEIAAAATPTAAAACEKPNSTTLISIPDVVCYHLHHNGEETLAAQGELRIIRLTLPGKDDAAPVYDAIYLTVAESVSHPLMPRSLACKQDLHYTFPFPMNQFYRIALPCAQVDSDMVSALDDCLAHYISFTNPRKLKKSLALVDAAGEVLAVLDSDTMNVKEASNTSEIEKMPFFVDFGGSSDCANVEIVAQTVDGELDQAGEALARKFMGLGSSTSNRDALKGSTAESKASRTFWDSVMDFLAVIEGLPPPTVSTKSSDQQRPVLRVTTFARNEANPYVLITPASYTISQRFAGSLFAAVNSSRRYVQSRYGNHIAEAKRFAASAWQSVVETLEEVFSHVDDQWHKDAARQQARDVSFATRPPLPPLPPRPSSHPRHSIQTFKGRPTSILSRPISLAPSKSSRAAKDPLKSKAHSIARPLSIMGRPLNTATHKGAGALAANLGLRGEGESGVGNEVMLVYYDQMGLSHPAIIRDIQGVRFA